MNDTYRVSSCDSVPSSDAGTLVIRLLARSLSFDQIRMTVTDAVVEAPTEFADSVSAAKTHREQP